MNQILVTQKLYITPELKKKKKKYKVQFILSIFLVCLLFSYYIYAEYDKVKSEEVSKAILADVDIKGEDDTTISSENNKVLVVVLDDDSNYQETENEAEQVPAQVETTASGTKYSTIGVVNIPKLDVSYPILSETSDELLKISVCKFWGPEPNKVGNFCIVGHNYRNTKFFSKVPTLENGDIIEVKDLTGKTVKYAVYDKYTVAPEDVACTSQLTSGKREVTLITCTNDSKKRVVLKTTEVL